MPTANRTPWEEIVGKAMDACTRAFGEGADQVTYTHLGGAPYTIDGIFEANSEAADPDTGAMVLTNTPQISFRLSAMQRIPRQGDQVQIRGKAYRVAEPDFDGQGTVTLRLHER